MLKLYGTGCDMHEALYTLITRLKKNPEFSKLKIAEIRDSTKIEEDGLSIMPTLCFDEQILFRGQVPDYRTLESAVRGAVKRAELKV
jgi:hypothetical protein